MAFKNMNLPVAVVVAIIGCVLAVSANVNASKTNQSLAKERYNRIVAEQKLQEAQHTVKLLKEELAQSKSKIEGIERIINQGRTVNSDLQAQLEGLQAQLQKVANEKSSLQQKLQQAVAEVPQEAPIP